MSKINNNLFRFIILTCGLLTSISLAGCKESSDSGRTDSAVDTGIDQKPVKSVQKKSGWESFIIDPTNHYVYPDAVHVAGEATSAINPENLKEADGQCTTISSQAVSAYLNEDSLEVDLGINTGGYVEIGMCGSSAPLRVSYAERREWLNPDGDYSGDNIGQDDDPEVRSHTVEPGAIGKTQLEGIQGAQRWISLILDGPGTASIDYIRVRIQHLRATPDDYVGRFYSSDELLNRIWFQSAYTMNLVALQDPERIGNRVYVDGAKRDRMVWLGDVGNQGLAAYYSHKEGPRIMRDTLAMFGCQQFPGGYLPMFSQIYITCDPFNPGQPDGPVPHDIEPLEEVGRLGEYTAWWVIGLADYYTYTGDKKFVQAQLPVARRTIDFFESKSNGGVYCTGQAGEDTPPPSLLEIYTPILDEIPDLLDVIGTSVGACLPTNPFEINWHPFDIASGEEMHTNAVIYRAYKELAKLEKLIGRGDQASQEIEELAELRRTAMINKFWREQTGAFVGNTFNPRENHTQDGNVEALLSGIVSEDDAARILDFMDSALQGPFGTLTGEFDDDPFMQRLYAPFVGSRELIARFKHFDTAGALQQIRKLWGHMATHDPESTVWERVGQDGNIPAYNLRVDFGGSPSLTRPEAGFTSAAHGWGAGPINALSGYIAGIRPKSPGFSDWLIEPQLGDLEWAQGQIMTPHGLIESRWERDIDSFRLTVVSPIATQGTVAVPTNNDNQREIYLDGAKVWPIDSKKTDSYYENGYVYIQNVKGKATFSWN